LYQEIFSGATLRDQPWGCIFPDNRTPKRRRLRWIHFQKLSYRLLPQTSRGEKIKESAEEMRNRFWFL